MKTRFVSLPLLALSLLFASCGEPETAAPATEETKPKEEAKSSVSIADISKIRSKTMAEVEAVLGKPESTEKVKGYPCEKAACEKAIYKTGQFEIIFKEGKADRITINNTPDLSKDEKALEALGLPSSAPTSKTAISQKWTDVNDIHETTFFSDYILVQVSTPE